MAKLRLGIDIGSTTVKVAVVDEGGSLVFSRYARHFTNIAETLGALFAAAEAEIGTEPLDAVITGSGGLSIAEWIGVPFVQEVVAVATAVRFGAPECDVAIEIGGEDAKIIYFTGGLEQRMNGICAGGTGAFIDQMAALLQTDAAGLNRLAEGASNIYPIAARCGVFAKSDVQPLINEGASREDLAASIFAAVVAQTISGLACGKPIRGNVMFLGGPLHFLPELRQRFVKVLNLEERNALSPENGHLFAAMGAAYSTAHSVVLPGLTLSELIHNLHNNKKVNFEIARLEPLFRSETALTEFTKSHKTDSVVHADLTEYSGPCFLGIDAGSTTTKLALIGADGELLHSSYQNNQGNPLKVIIDSLNCIYETMPDCAYISQSCVTGYGENLVKAALCVDLGEIETVAHYRAAAHFVPDVDFILDIGGQDMKCIRVKDGAIENVLLNEACSAGCGSFIETFAASMGYTASEFAEIALFAGNPIDLGSRCTVFMNSRVKQAQKEGADVGDIAAGLAYSVVKNALQKVIKITDPQDLGSRAVVQGGTFLNDAVLRAFEQIAGKRAARPDIAGLMGAYGAALIARDKGQDLEDSVPKPLQGASPLDPFVLDDEYACGSVAVAAGERVASGILTREKLVALRISPSLSRCKGCGNNCLLTVNRFTEIGDNSVERRFISGNRCERVQAFSGNEDSVKLNSELPNLYAYKNKRVFDYEPLPEKLAKRGVVGIPRVLNMYENYPLWHTLFTELGYSVKLSPCTTRGVYEKGMESMPSESVCYPAKLAHGHIMELIGDGVKFIFYPSVVYEKDETDSGESCYNCPIVASYPENIRLNVEELRTEGIDFRNPFLTLNNKKALLNGLAAALPEVPKREISRALKKALTEQERFCEDVRSEGERALEYLRQSGQRGVVLAGRPYHADPEINHGIPEMITGFGVAVLSEDSVAHLPGDNRNIRLNVRDQWMYHSRLYSAARFVCGQPNIDLIQLNSFGCGLDAVTTDEVQDILNREGKIFTLLKIDEVNNLGSARIRVRSLFAALRARDGKYSVNSVKNVKPHLDGFPLFAREMKYRHTVLSPQMSPLHFELVQEAFQAEGYDLRVLPAMDKDAVDIGLRYVNNDACYPAVIVVGQVLKAVFSGEYDTEKLSVVMTQTGGGCRASNYVGFIRRALVKAGFPGIPVIALSAQGFEKHPGMKLGLGLLNKSMQALIYGDLLMRTVYATRPYEKVKGAVDGLCGRWVRVLKGAVRRGKFRELKRNTYGIIKDFDEIELNSVDKPKVGVVGEILVKYHPTANNDIVGLLEAEGAEAVVPDLTDFFLYGLYNSTYKWKYFGGSWWVKCLTNVMIRVIERYRGFAGKALTASRRFVPPQKITELAKLAKPIVSMGNQSGEGWFLTAEMIELIKSGVKNIVCAQPFACLPNHVTGKGIIKELRRLWPGTNVVAVDYDPGASEVNQLNRIKLMLSVATESMGN
ncbi:MAG: 2-hydroxyacyl-CoA dehydratase [Defluviitaleaceae bacterium]|nr:2-hydroxyacyl-CoA dehydratase [Defluviitaleaceae bacterium]MCL2835192.1 2-hydroxyacyl-CoA dehydratase [Defluviitaleaceae bacterium]